MQRILASLFVSVAFLAGSAARAEFIHWGATTGNTTVFNNNNSLQSSSLVFQGVTHNNLGTSQVGVGSTPLGFYSVTVNSSASPDAPDSFSAVPYSLPFTLTDIKSVGVAGAISTGTANVPGVVSASASRFSFVPGSFTYGSAQITLGAPNDWRLYTVTASTPAMPGPFIPGTVELDVSVAAGSEPTPSATPEPTSLALAAFALPVAWMLRRRGAARADPRVPPPTFPRLTLGGKMPS